MIERGVDYATSRLVDFFGNCRAAARTEAQFIYWSFGRVVVSLPGLVTVCVSLQGLATTPAGEDKTTWIAALAVGGLVSVLTTRWLGGGRGVLWGFWLWLLSVGHWNGFVSLAVSVVQIVGLMGGLWQADWRESVIYGIVGAGFYALCKAGLARAARLEATAP